MRYSDGGRRNNKIESVSVRMEKKVSPLKSFKWYTCYDYYCKNPTDYLIPFFFFFFLLHSCRGKAMNDQKFCEILDTLCRYPTPFFPPSLMFKDFDDARLFPATCSIYYNTHE